MRTTQSLIEKRDQIFTETVILRSSQIDSPLKG